MAFEARWGSVCANCGEDLRPGQEIELKGEHQGYKNGNEYVHVNPDCERVANVEGERPFVVTPKRRSCGPPGAAP